MFDISVSNSSLLGQVQMPPSKSQVHRAIICAALSKGISKIHPVALSKDALATIDAVRALGAVVEIKKDCVTVDGRNIFSPNTAEINCNESGSTLRFFIPIAALGGIDCLFTGEGLLVSRPIGEFLELLPTHGVQCESKGGLPLKISGKLTGNTYEIAGNVSSQYITGLLLALPLLENDSHIILTTPLQSSGYVDMTIDVMKNFGVVIEKTENGYFIKGNQKYLPQDFTIEGDWSQAGFFFAAGAINGDIIIKGLRLDSLQGDKRVLDVFKEMGADISVSDDEIHVKKSALHPISIDVSQIPDTVPAIAVACCIADGKSIISGGERLRIKESDRIACTVDALTALGATAKEMKDGIEIFGNSQIHGGTVDSCNDHRIAMAFAVLASTAKEDVIILQANSVEKSYPDFWAVYKQLGGTADVISMGK